VIDALIGVSVPNLSGGYSAMMPNHHITKPVLIGEIQADGQFNIVSQTPGLVVAQEWSPYVADTKDLIGDWRKPLSCGAFNVKTKMLHRRQEGLTGGLIPGDFRVVRGGGAVASSRPSLPRFQACVTKKTMPRSVALILLVAVWLFPGLAAPRRRTMRSPPSPRPNFDAIRHGVMALSVSGHPRALIVMYRTARMAGFTFGRTKPCSSKTMTAASSTP
jgi:hypothetical protein